MGSLEDLLMCSVCIDRYHEKVRQPVLLPRCGHSFCRTCVALLVSSGCIICPTCRTDQRIECVDRLPTEYTLLAIINAQEIYKKETCEQHQVKLSFWCKTCNTAACGECLFEDHPLHEHDILRSAKYISDMKQNSSDITTKFFDSLSRKEESLYRIIFESTCRISQAFKNIRLIRKDTEEARELMKSIHQDATITSATTLHETAKFLGLKWNIQDANTEFTTTQLDNESPIVDLDDEISIEKEKIKKNAKVEENNKAALQSDKNEHTTLQNSKPLTSIDIIDPPEKIEQIPDKQMSKASKLDELNELEQLEKAIEESLKDQKTLSEEIKKDEVKICKELSSNRKEKHGKKASKKKLSSVQFMNTEKTDEQKELVQVNNGREVVLLKNNVMNDKDPISVEGDNTDSNIHRSPKIGTENPEEHKVQILETKEEEAYESETINTDALHTADSKSFNDTPSAEINQTCAKLSDCIQVSGFMMCVEGQNGRLGQMTWGPQGLHIHALQFQQVDYDIVITTTLFKLLSPTVCPVIFLEIYAEEILLGRVYIRLWGNLRRASNFLSLCLGDNGISYVNTKFLQVYNVGSPGERLLGGDYEYNTGKGGMGVLDDLEWNQDYAIPMKAGMITAAGSGQSANNSLFLICTQSDPTRNFSCPFGNVFQGLEVVKEAVKLATVKHVYISDCGVLIVPPGASAEKNIQS